MESGPGFRPFIRSDFGRLRVGMNFGQPGHCRHRGLVIQEAGWGPGRSGEGAHDADDTDAEDGVARGAGGAGEAGPLD